MVAEIGFTWVFRRWWWWRRWRRWWWEREREVGALRESMVRGVKVDQEITKLLSLICYLNIIDFFRLDIIFRGREQDVWALASGFYLDGLNGR